MLKCSQIVEHADALLASELTPGRRFTVQMHLLICRHCRRYVRQLRQLLRSIAAMHGPADDEQVRQVLNAVENAEKGPLS